MDLEKVSEIYVHETLQHLPSNEEIRKTHRFSDKFRKNMAKIMRGLNERDQQTRRKSRIIRLGNNLQRFTAVIFLFVVFFFTLGMSVDAVREPLFRMTEVVFKDHIDLIPEEYLEQYEKEHLVGEQLLQHYVSKLEELGYEQTGTKELGGGTYVDFRKEDVELFLFRVGYKTDGHTGLDYYQADECKTLNYSGKKFIYSAKKCVICWDDEDATYMLKGSVNETELLNLIKDIF